MIDTRGNSFQVFSVLGRKLEETLRQGSTCTLLLQKKDALAYVSSCEDKGEGPWHLGFLDQLLPHANKALGQLSYEKLTGSDTRLKLVPEKDSLSLVPDVNEELKTVLF